MLKPILMLFLFALAACSSAQATPIDSGIEGAVWIGPICPVVREGRNAPTSRIKPF